MARCLEDAQRAGQEPRKTKRALLRPADEIATNAGTELHVKIALSNKLKEVGAVCRSRDAPTVQSDAKSGSFLYLRDDQVRVRAP